VRDDLRASEDRLAAFFSGNRVYENSPSLSLTQTRLTRDMELQRQLNATLSQQAEQAKLDEVRDTPVLTVLERPDLPLRPEPRGTVRFTLFALVGGSVLGVLFGLLSDTMRRAAGAAPTQAAESRRRDARASGATADGGGARPRAGPTDRLRAAGRASDRAGRRHGRGRVRRPAPVRAARARRLRGPRTREASAGPAARRCR
jgi:hypothetical protein